MRYEMGAKHLRHKIEACQTTFAGLHEPSLSPPSVPESDSVSEASPLHSQAAVQLFNGIKASTTGLQLNEFMKLVFRALTDRRIDEDEHNHLVGCITARRPRTQAAGPRSLGATGSRLCRHFVSRQPQRSPDRQKSRERRRTLGGSSALPPGLRAHYTEGHRAVLSIVALEIKLHGLCDFAIDKIAAMAGVCRTTVQNALHEARKLGHVTITVRPRPPKKNLTNIVRIVSAEWRTWISRVQGDHGRIGSKTAKTVSPTKKEDSLEERFTRTYPQGAPANSKSNQPKSRWPDSWVAQHKISLPQYDPPSASSGAPRLTSQ